MLEHLLQKRCFFGQKHSLTCGYAFFRGGGIDDATLCDALRVDIPLGVSPPTVRRNLTGQEDRIHPDLVKNAEKYKRKYMQTTLGKNGCFFGQKHPLTCENTQKSS